MAGLAADVRVDHVETREGPLAKATLAVISNGYRNGESEPTLVRWTLWGKQAENAGKYLAKGSRVNVVGALRNNNYDRNGETVYGFNFTAEEVDYLDSRGSFEQPRSEAATTEEAPVPAPAPAAPSGELVASLVAPVAFAWWHAAREDGASRMAG
jgi:single-stranded DNA-binding protein